MAVPATELLHGDGSLLKPLGQRLLDAGVISQAQLNLALREKDRTGIYLGTALVNLGFITDDILTNSLAAETHTQVVDVNNVIIDDQVLKRVPYEMAKRYRLLPLSEAGDTLTVAMADAFDVVAIDALEKHTSMVADVTSAPESDIVEALERHYAQSNSIEDTVELLMRSSATDDFDVPAESPMIRLVDQIVALAIKLRATDIHVEPDEKVMRVRMRVDGVLRQELLIPIRLRDGLIARLKLMADVNITEKRLPQDGRFRFLYGRREIDLRVSTLPTHHGESVVMRILDSADTRPGFADLGLPGPAREKLEEMLEHPFGMILVTGPTGSGKTTTLYSLLSEIDAVQRSIFTLEDPIEYSIPLVRQTQVRTDIGMTFAAGLRALLRQDPDVVLIGEMRDLETAQLAVRAALTGHLVFTTLHTNNAVGVIPRLVDMGVERYLLPAALSAVVGQRLIRKICSECAEPDPDAARWRDQFPELLGDATSLMRGHGCPACKQSGFRGRRAIFELLVLDDDFHDAILARANARELESIAMGKGMRTMLMDGMRHAAAGDTSAAEVLRVVR
ncbi:MAG: Flp pilus assembly complex ATPase component TadA [Gammaproteobacteria bacterium]|nr:Flp pilus assembly complex ATPase component TadA [Gammaproteobacteria bacterium]